MGTDEAKKIYKACAELVEVNARQQRNVSIWRQRMGTDEAKEIYKACAELVEVNARQQRNVSMRYAITRNRGLQQFTVRGLKKTKTVLLWFVLAHNLKREAALRPVEA